MDVATDFNTIVTLDDTKKPQKLPSMAPRFEFVFQTRVITNTAHSLGNLHGSGERLVMTVAGGDAEGPGFKATILQGGTEWPLRRPDGVDSIDARYTMRTDDGVLINIRNTGYRVGAREVMARLKTEIVDANAYYFRTYALFEAPLGKYDWLTKNVFVGFGERHPELLYLWYYKVL